MAFRHFKRKRPGWTLDLAGRTAHRGKGLGETVVWGGKDEGLGRRTEYVHFPELPRGFDDCVGAVERKRKARMRSPERGCAPAWLRVLGHTQGEPY